MSDVLEIREIPEVPPELIEAAKDGKLVLFLGAGTSISVGLPSWDGFADAVLTQLVAAQIITYRDIDDLKALDPKKKLSIATSLAEGSGFRINYRKILEPKKESLGIYEYLNSMGCPVVTTNYDLLSSPTKSRSTILNAGTVDVKEEIAQTEVSVRRLFQPEDFLVNRLRKPETVAHIHGCVEDQNSMVVTTKDYLKHYYDDRVQEFLGQLFVRHTVLFIGYGLEEAEILEHILRRAKTGKEEKENKRFILQGYFSSQGRLAGLMKKYFDESFGVHLCPFSFDSKHYSQLEDVVKDWSSRIQYQARSKTDIASEILDGIKGENLNDIGPEQENTLDAISDNDDLIRLFFYEVRSIIWFDTLLKRDYFSAEKNPEPIEREGGKFKIPSWPACHYLAESSSELQKEENVHYGTSYMVLVREITEHAKANSFSNYNTWWCLSKVLSNMPVDVLEDDDVDLISYWLNDRFETGLAIRELERWLEELPVEVITRKLDFFIRLAENLYTAQYKNCGSSSEREIAFFPYDNYSFVEFNITFSSIMGKVAGSRGTEMFERKLIDILDREKSDDSSYRWRAAIEDEDQNFNSNDARQYAVVALRNSIKANFENNFDDALLYIEDRLYSQYKIIQRISIHTVNQCFEDIYSSRNSLFDSLMDLSFFVNDYRHELWSLLNKNYLSLTEQHKSKLISTIDSIRRDDEKSTAYEKASWLQAIADKDSNAQKKYEKCVAVAGVEPENADNPFKVVVSAKSYQSPLTLQEMQEMYQSEELVDYLNGYEVAFSFNGPDLSGLASMFSEFIKDNLESLQSHLTQLLELKNAFLYEILKALRATWEDNPQVTIDWSYVFSFIDGILAKENFWEAPIEDESRVFIGSRNSVISEIGRLIESGCKSDEHAFAHSFISRAKTILKSVLDRQEGREFTAESNAVSIAINSSRGQSIEAIINLALFACRQQHREQDSHSDVWNDFEPIFTAELAKIESDQYEFSTLVTQYFSHFLYLSKEWTERNLPIIFQQENYVGWLCAMQGFVYINHLLPTAYQYLKESGDFIKALDDSNLKEITSKRIVELIVVSFHQGEEALDDNSSLLYKLIERGNAEELSHIIWYYWSPKDEDYNERRPKVYELWPKILDSIDLRSSGGQKVASDLCRWACFIDVLDEKRTSWLKTVVPFVQKNHNGYEVLKVLARLSNSKPEKVHDVLTCLLQVYSEDYPEDAIKDIFRSFVRHGSEGRRWAKEVSDIFIKHGTHRPIGWLEDIEKEIGSEL